MLDEDLDGDRLVLGWPTNVAMFVFGPVRTPGFLMEDSEKPLCGTEVIIFVGHVKLVPTQDVTELQFVVREVGHVNDLVFDEWQASADLWW